MKQGHKRLMACSVAGVGVLLMAAIAWADMGKTAPALPAPSGSKAESAIKEGMIHYEQGHWDVAKKHFEKAVQADDQSAEAHYDLALALDKSGDHQAAIQHFKAAQQYGKDNPEIQNSGILQAHLKAKH
jgi:Tfp pilus assembly protein PilF